MTKTMLIVVGALAVLSDLAAPAPVEAQAGQNVLIVYGKDPCPTTKAGEEIVVCARKPESERYRIPEELRSTTPGPNDRWADRAKSLEYVGASGPSSCTPSGGGDWTGCWSRLMNQARDEKKAQAAADIVPER